LRSSARGVWQIVSYFTPAVLFPSVPQIAVRWVEIFSSGHRRGARDRLRILAGLAAPSCSAASWPADGALGRLRRYCPLLTFSRGIPALSWVVVAIIWFHGIEFIWFIMVMATLPAFTFQVLDLYDVEGPVRDDAGFRPSRYDLFRTLIWPTVLPASSPPGRSTSATRRAWSSSPSWSARTAASTELMRSSRPSHGGRDRLDHRAGRVRAGVQGIISAIEAHALSCRAAGRTL
jgi:hypothetical protein